MIINRKKLLELIARRIEIHTSLNKTDALLAAKIALNELQWQKLIPKHSGYGPVNVDFSPDATPEMIRDYFKQPDFHFKWEDDKDDN